MVRNKLLQVCVVLLIAGGIFPVTPAAADVNFGHTESVENTVEDLDENVREQRTSGESGDDVSGCTRDYPDWLEDVEDRADLREELLEPDTGTSSSISVKDNPNFVEEDDGGNVTADTILRRCNTHFRDSDYPDTQHWVYCRAMQLPSGDTFTNLKALKNDPDSAPSDLYTAAFFHGSNVDDPSENWLVPMINKYKDRCYGRSLNIIWVGVWVRDMSVSPPDYNLSLGNRWHVTASKWKNTVLFDVMKPSKVNFSGHSTASCPFDDDDDADSKPEADTHGLWVGGTAENEGRRINGKYTDKQALWVGDNSDSQAACYSGVSDSNPVNANPGRGVQFEYQVTVPDTSEKWVDPDSIADYVLDEF